MRNSLRAVFHPVSDSIRFSLSRRIFRGTSLFGDPERVFVAPGSHLFKERIFMKSTLATVPVRQEHPPQPTTSATDSYPLRRVGPLDRAALHLGVALIKWGRRPVKVDPRELRRLSEETNEARREQEELRDQFLALNFFR